MHLSKYSHIENHLSQIKTPSYVLEEDLLEKNLILLHEIEQNSGAKILCALKGFAFWHAFGLVSKYLSGGCASGLHEAKLASQEIAKEVHTYSPAYKEDEIDEIAELSHHMVFNSFSQWKRYKDRVLGKCSCGLRVNPEISSAPAEIYNPCAPYSRLGITKIEFNDNELEGIEGLHFHALCEESAESLRLTLEVFEEKFGKYLHKMKWVNFGGGHHITKEGYDVSLLTTLIQDFKSKYNLDVYLEPGEAIGWQTGSLITTVVDIIHNGINIAILDISAEAHMPDTLAMPYRADVKGSERAGVYEHTYRLGGNSCLAGDVMGDYSFKSPLKIGDKLIFEDMMHYSVVKNTTFNGIPLPSLSILTREGSYKVVKEFGYETYKNRN